MAKQETVTYDSIIKDLRNKTFHPVYLLMGEESYFIDVISNYIENNILSEVEKEFNLTVLYGKDANGEMIINAAKRYPMMSDRQIVIVKEAQELRTEELSKLIYYFKKPLDSTLLVISYKHGKINANSKVVTEAKKCGGVVFESKYLKESSAQIKSFVTNYVKRKKVEIEEKALSMIIDNVGNDLSHLINEVNKLIISLPQNHRRITPDDVERSIGVSKEYNSFELKQAIVDKNFVKANKIIQYFEKNPKKNPVQMIFSLLFSFFSNLMLAYYAPNKSENGIAEALGLKFPWQAKEYIAAMRKYKGIETFHIIKWIRYADARSKGAEGSTSDSGTDILKDLVFKIICSGIK